MEKNKNCKEEPKNCWEFMGCSEENKKTCEAYKNDMGKECFYIQNLVGDGEGKKKFGECFKCGWYKKLNASC